MIRNKFYPWFAFVLLFSALSAPAQDNGYWRAGSKTAQSITGDIVIAAEKLTINFSRFTIADIRRLKSSEVSSMFDVPADETNAGALYRLSIPSDKKFLHRNTLCGSEETQWMATFASGRDLYVAFFSGGSMPVFTPEAMANSPSLCGTFTYHR